MTVFYMLLFEVKWFNGKSGTAHEVLQQVFSMQTFMFSSSLTLSEIFKSSTYNIFMMNRQMGDFSTVMRFIWQIHTCSLFSQLEELIFSSAGNNIVGGEITGGTDLFLTQLCLWSQQRPITCKSTARLMNSCLLSVWVCYLCILLPFSNTSYFELANGSQIAMLYIFV